MSAKEAGTTAILRVVDAIQNHSKPAIGHCCRAFLLHSRDPGPRAYADATGMPAGSEPGGSPGRGVTLW